MTYSTAASTSWDHDVFVAATHLRLHISRMSFSGLMASAHPRIEVEEMGNRIQVRIYTSLPDRDDPKRMLEVVFVEDVDPRMVAHVPAESILHRILRSFWDHEFRESVRLDGVLVDDPHK